MVNNICESYKNVQSPFKTDFSKKGHFFEKFPNEKFLVAALPAVRGLLKILIISLVAFPPIR